MMTSLRSLLVAAGLLGLGLAPAATGAEHGFLDRTYRDAAGKEFKYVLFVPYDYQGDKAYPLILYLHGSGEGGTDGRKPVHVGLGPAIRKQEMTFPFLALFPQTPRSDWDADAEDSRRALAILDEVQQTYRVDPQRVYLTGMSSGGDGTWSFAIKDPRRWAALVPVCGEGDPREAGKIKDIPCWYFMGSADSPNDVKLARAMVEALKAAGADLTYTEYPGLGHGIWDKAYGTPELYEWLLKQHRK
jgi:predicted peptidase